MRINKVLLVDDVEPLRLFVAMSINRSDDFQVVAEAANAEKALEEAAKARPDVVLLDVNMPGRTGLDILPQLRKMLPRAAIVMFSGFESVAIAEKAKQLGADAYVEKGTPSTELLDILRDLTAEATGPS